MGSFLTRNYRLLFVLLMVCIVGLAFYVGTLVSSKEQGNGIVFSCSEEVLAKQKIPLVTISQIVKEETTQSTGSYAGSKNGTKYYTPGCAGLNRIKPENLIWFESAEDATLQGYTPAKC